jgi:hypothetical protein
VEPGKHRLAGALAVVALASGCGGSSAIALAPSWDGAGVPVTRDVFGHNTVWAQSGLGLWDEAMQQPVPQALDAVTALAPTLLRFPGGTRAMRYHFAQAIGDPRTPQCDPFRGVTDDTKYGPNEFLGVAASLGTDVTWVAPWVDGSPDETAALAQFLAPHANVKYLEVGNEPYLGLPAGPPTGSCGRPTQFVQDERWVGDTRIPTTAADYAAELAATAAKVRPAAPALLIGAPATSQYDGESDAMDAVGDIDNTTTHDPWNRRLLSDAHDAFDFFVLHPYDFSVDDDARMRLAERARKTVRDLRAAAPDKKVAITEYGFLFGGGTLLNAVVTADMTRMAIEEQLLMLARHILIETDASGPFADAAAIGPDYAAAPAYAALQLVRSLGDVAYPTPDLVADGTLVALPTRSSDKGYLAVLLIDRRTDDGPAREVRVTLPPGHFTAAPYTLSATSLGDRQATLDNGLAEAVTGSVTVRVPAHGVVLLSAKAQ